MRSNLSSENYRHARRFACDHCRAYKLRCERDSRVGTSCSRCLKTQLACTTTANHPPQRRPSATPQEQPTTDGRDGRKSAGNTTKQVRPREPGLAVTRALSSQFGSTAPEPQQHERPPPTLSSPPRQQRETQPAGKDLISYSLPKSPSQRQPDSIVTRTVDIIEGYSMNSEESVLRDQNCLILDEIDFNMPDICYDTADMAFLIADASAHAGTGSRRGDGANLGMFGEDQTTMDVNAWESSNSAPSSVFVEAGRDPVTDSENHVHPPNKSYKELLELSLELIEDQELLDTQAPLNSKQNHGAVCSNSQQHHPINRMLNHTTHFWGMLKRISVTSEAPQNQCSSYENTATESSSNSRHSNIGQEMMWAGAADTSYGNMDSSSLPPPSLVCLPQQDHLLIVNLVTTYVYLVRNCQGVFTRLYNALEVSPTADYSSILNLPSLQFGEFQLPNNPAIQVKVLIELISSMLLRIEETLGISQVSASRRSSLTESQNYQLSILNDPMAVSIREIILSQERMQGGIYSGELAFSDIISNLKQLLERK